MTQAKLADSSPSSRRLFNWAAVHAWKLAGLTAFVTFVGVFIAVSLSLLLRPTRSYFFPLLSDVDKHQPEGAILRIALAVSTALLFATTSASFLHCHSVSFFRQLPDPHPHTAADHDAITVAQISPVEVAYHIASPHSHNAPQSHHVTELHDITPAHARRRAPLFNTLQLIILIPMLTIILLTFIQYSGLAVALSNINRKHLIQLGIYLLCITWCFAMGFLVWYFLKLQGIPDRAALTDSDPIDDVENSYPETVEFTTSRTRIVDRFRAWAAWCVVILRPICLTGQVVCVIKIVGLWLALDTFSISNIRFVKITLLAALAFAEYTAAFFFAFFMTILAVDMRSKTISADLLQT